MRILGYYEVFSLLITYKFHLYDFLQKKDSGNLCNFILPRLIQMFASFSIIHRLLP